MDFRSLQQHRDKLEQELLTLKGCPLEAPTVLRLIKSEITRLNEILLSTKQDNVRVDVHRLKLMDHVSKEFGLSDASSVLSLSDKLMEEVLSIKHPLFCIIIFTTSVFQRLHQEAKKELDNVTLAVVPTASTKPASDVSQVFSGSSQRRDDTLARENLVWCIRYAIETTMNANPQDLSVDQITKLLQLTAISVNVDDEDVKRLISQKCEEAIQARNKEEAQGDKGERISKRD